MHDRIYQGTNGQWYYRTRGNDAGPFKTRQEAEHKLNKKLRGWKREMGILSIWPRQWHLLRLFRRSVTRQSS